VEALEIIRRMAVRYGDDQIASVLNRRGYSTGKGMRWNQIRVATARRNHSIAGQKRALPDPERVSLSQAARMCGVSHAAPRPVGHCLPDDHGHLAHRHCHDLRHLRLSPLFLARLVATLDQVSSGRIGWNAVTGRSDYAAMNFGLPGMAEHDLRYDMADEYMAAVRALWASGEPGAVIADRESGVLIDRLRPCSTVPITWYWCDPLQQYYP
jgi:hypothetical protein